MISTKGSGDPSANNRCRCPKKSKDYGLGPEEPRPVPYLRKPSRLVSRASRLVRPDPHQLLAEIGALEKSHERGRRAVETLGDELLVLDLALADPPRHVAQKGGVTRGEIADDEAADGQALRQHRTHHRGGPFRRLCLGVVVMRDQAADGNAGESVQ